MHINTISLINFGVFRGRHVIDLATKPDKPVIIFGGKNGAGKSTLLEAVYLCLYGPLAAGTRASKDDYARYLEQHIHSSPSLMVQPTFAAVSIEFSYADLGRVHVYEVARSWGKTGAGKTADRLDVKRDGVSLGELGSEQWQDFIKELIPLGVSSLFFFDGEKIQHLAEDSTDQIELAHSIKALLGINLIDRLQTDLSIYQSRLAKANGNAVVGDDFESLNRERFEAQSSLSSMQLERQKVQESLGNSRTHASQIEQSIAAEGGGFAKRRDGLIRRREEARAKITTAEGSIRHLCASLLPFSYAAELLRSLRDQLLAEQRYQADEAGAAMVASAKFRFTELLEADPAFNNKSGDKLRRRALDVLERAISTLAAGHREGGTVIHALSPAATQQLLLWIDLALVDIPRSAQLFGNELEMAHRDLQKAETELKKVPADEVLKPLIERLNTTNQQIGDASRQLASLDEKVRVAEGYVAEVQRRLDTELDRLKQQTTKSAQLQLVPKINVALQEFSARLIADRVCQLEHELTVCFNVLSRKTDSVRRVSISPVDFSVTLFDRGDAPIAKQALSAGEKQIYAIAVLWALARVSKRPLPLIIDTPLGRLDSDHRKLLVEGYFPTASHQVVLLSTDTEVDNVYFDALKPFVAKAYRLEFDMAERCTTVATGYFRMTEEI